MEEPGGPLILHATTVAIGGRGLLIQGASGSGKSALALQLMQLGAELVADDRTALHLQNGQLIADAPDTIRGLIEARGVGILNATAAGPTPVAAVVDMDQSETDRLPQRRSTDIAGMTLPLFHNCGMPHFPAALRQYMLFGRNQ